jgi:hypothetical protein
VGDRTTVVIELASAADARDLGAGGVFVPGCALGIDADCALVVRGAGGELSLEARCVFVGNGGAGLQLYRFTPELKAQILALLEAPPPPLVEEPTGEDDGDGDDDDDDDDEKRVPRNVHERLRGLTLVQQVKLARTGEQHERIVLERIYGKTVWEPLLHNPRITPPEVARIARMGTLPRPMLELICGNGAWLQVPEVRRALLGNPRLGTDQVIKVLRMLPKHELKLASTQTAYPFVVRDQAKKLMRTD